MNSAEQVQVVTYGDFRASKEQNWWYDINLTAEQLINHYLPT